jgi:ribosomal protein L6P/L9E
MFFFQSFFIENIKKSIVYNENNKLIILSNKSQSTFIVSKIESLLFKNNNITVFYTNNKYLNNKIIYSLNQIRFFISANLYGLASRFRMIGRGYYLYSNKNILYFRLGFSHVIKFILPLDTQIKKKKKKKNFWVLHGFSLNQLSHIQQAIRGLRGPNLYSKRIKGISLYNEFIPRGVNSLSKF